jgi:flavoprotein
VSDYIVDDRKMYELWDKIQNMTDAEKEALIREYEEKQSNKQN